MASSSQVGTRFIFAQEVQRLCVAVAFDTSRIPLKHEESFMKNLMVSLAYDLRGGPRDALGWPQRQHSQSQNYSGVATCFEETKIDFHPLKRVYQFVAKSTRRQFYVHD